MTVITVTFIFHNYFKSLTRYFSFFTFFHFKPEICSNSEILRLRHLYILQLGHLHNSQWITFPTQSCLILYFFCSIVISGRSSNNSSSSFLFCFCFVSFNDISTFVCYLMPKPSLLNSSNTIKIIAEYYYYYYYFTPCEIFNLRLLVVVHWNLSDNKST